MKKQTSYQKLKDKNAELRSDIMILIEGKNFLEKERVKQKHLFPQGIANMVLFGERTNYTNEKSSK